MNERDKNKISKFLSLILRHNPGTIGLHLDEQGWADVGELLSKAAVHQHPFSINELKEVVLTNDKQRFSFNEDGSKIRASQGHSISVELNLEPVIPPGILYHGTVARFLESIKASGLKKKDRQHVHLSKDKVTAVTVGERRGEAILLSINSDRMHNDGFLFFLSENGVWLTDHVPVEYIDFKEE